MTWPLPRLPGLSLALAVLLLTAALTPLSVPAQSPQLFEIKLDPSMPASSGRLIIVATPYDKARRIGDRILFLWPPNPEGAYFVAAKEVPALAPGQTLSISADDIAYPVAFSRLPKGAYAIQAVLDVNHNFAYTPWPRDSDIFSFQVLKVDLPGPAPTLVLDRKGVDERPFDITNPAAAAAKANTDPIEFLSPSLTAFHGKPTYIRGWVVRPPGYATSGARYPTVYRTEGFGASLASPTNFLGILDAHGDMAKGITPPMIWVFLDHSGPTGTHEFADSANNGPWGKAFTEELIPHLERTYRMDARPSGRFLTGHSSGGWMALWAQVRYPKLFGGTWPTAPDPVDFREFTNIDIYRPGANAYLQPDGGETPLVRSQGNVTASFKAYTRFEDVLGSVGGQIASFEWVFSPKGADGKPMRLFDRRTGVVDPKVAAYWRDNYDIGHLIRTRWPQLKPDLDGKIHLTVGTADTYHLDQAAHLLKADLDRVGAKSDFRFIEGRTHGDLMAVGRDGSGLQKEMAWEMYAIARPAFVRPQASVGLQERMRRCGTWETPPTMTETFDPRTLDAASVRPPRAIQRDGRGNIAFIRESGPNVARYIMPSTPQVFRGSDGEPMGTLVLEPFCGEIQLTSPPNPVPRGSWAVLDAERRWAIRQNLQTPGDIPKFRYAAP